MFWKNIYIRVLVLKEYEKNSFKIKAKNNYEFGYKLGSKLKERIQKCIKDNKKLDKIKARKPKDFSVYIERAKKFLPTIKKNLPHLLEEACNTYK